MELFILQRDQVSQESKSAFKERDSCYINWTLHIISSTANILRIRINALRVSFFETRLHLAKKEKDLDGDGKEEGVHRAGYRLVQLVSRN